MRNECAKMCQPVLPLTASGGKSFMQSEDWPSIFARRMHFSAKNSCLVRPTLLMTDFPSLHVCVFPRLTPQPSEKYIMSTGACDLRAIASSASYLSSCSCEMQDASDNARPRSLSVKKVEACPSHSMSSQTRVASLAWCPATISRMCKNELGQTWLQM